MFLAATLFLALLLTLILLTRLKSQMAALVAWIVGTISGGGRSEDTDQERSNRTANDTEKSKSKKNKNKPKKSPTREPSFSTTLVTPIEEVIEETLNEDVSTVTSVETKPASKSRKRNKSSKSKVKPSEEFEDDVGFSFFQIKSKEKPNPSKLLEKVSPKSSPESTVSQSSSSDLVGFSFLPVKDKRQTKKNQKTKIDDLPKSTLIEHFASKRSKKTVSPLEAVKDFVVIEKAEEIKSNEPTTKILHDNLIEIVNKESGKVVYLEAKESKKVHSKISYASVASQRFEETLEQLRKEEESQKLNTSSCVDRDDKDKLTIENVQEDNSILSQKKENLVDDVNVQKIKSKNIIEINLSEHEFEIIDGEKNLVKISNGTDNVDVKEINEDLAITKLNDDSERLPQSNSEKEINEFSNLIKNEELETKIKSEERRLVDLIEEAQNKTNNETSADEVRNIQSESAEFVITNKTEEKVFVDLPSEIQNELIVSNKTTSDNSLREELVIIDSGKVSDEEIPFESEIINRDNFCFIVKSGGHTKTENLEVTDGEKSQGESDNKDSTENAVGVQGDTEVIDREDSKTTETEVDIVPVETEVGTHNTEKVLTGTQDKTSRDVDHYTAVVEEHIPSDTSDLQYTQETDLPAKPFKMSSGIQIRVLTLNDGEHQDSTLYRIEKNWVLQFRLGPSLLGRKVSLYCNYPEKGKEFNRHSYNLLKWRQDEGCHYADDTALLTDITPIVSGSFHYFFTYDNADTEEHQGSGFFLVDPVLKYGNNEELPLDCVQCQTVLTKGLGPFDTWENKLRVAKESGYNMIHFTPIQELGVSNSSYSLSEQLKVNSIFAKQNGQETTFEDVESLIKKLRVEWKMASICDIVLNHTANESKWLKEHPEVTYNCHTCPYMRPAYLLDAALHQFSSDVSKGVYEDKGLPTQVSTEDHLNSIRYHLHVVLAALNFHELRTCSIDECVAEFLTLIRSKTPNEEKSKPNEQLKLIQDPLYRRLASKIDMQLAASLYNVYRNDCYDEDTRIKKCAEDFKRKLDELNKLVVDEMKEHLNAAVENVIAGIRYFRVQHDGPKIKEISIKNPLVHRYFTDHGTPASIVEHEEIMYGDNGKFLMAHNGWVMNSDPLRNFAAPDSNVYIRRELIAWGDSVKLRFGDKPEDCPFLWNHMRTYVEQTAKIFDGVRLDNCHSTPIPVAEYLLDCARKVKPDLYVVAELFTNSDATDNVFVNRLGITSLIREAMSAWDSHEQGRLVYRYGGSPVGSFYQPRIRPLVPSIAHALFLDLTHDNPSPVEKRSVFDLLPSTALVNMACCASGSNRGYDELVPHHIHVVDETRQYAEWTEDEKLALGNSKYVTRKSGIIAAKKALNDLHLHLGSEGFDQVYVDQMDPDVVAVTRHCPDTHQSYVLVAFTAFSHPPEDAAYQQRGMKPLRVEGVLDEIVLEATLDHVGTTSSNSKYAKSKNFHKDNKWINGLSEYQAHLKQHLQPEESDIFEKVDSGSPNVVQLNLKNFKPGSVAVIKVSLPEEMKRAIKNVRDLISQFSLKKESELWKIVSEMTLPDLNRALYRCGQEERDEGHGFDTYNIPNFGSLVYAGFQGFMSLLCNIRPSNDLGHPMCANLRDGNWMIDYIWQRLKFDEGTKRLGQWLEENTKSLKSIPRYLVPCYFDVIVTGIYILLFEQSHKIMSDFVNNGSTFVKGLAMGSVQFAAYIKSADLPVLSPNLSEPKPLKRKNDKGENVQACVTLSAGLPHFSVGYMRNWGRDTFIALRGLFLLTGRYQDARYHILGYAACLRHGLIPNLLDGGRNSRFNCRDAVWWWLYCIKCYAEDAPNGLELLSDKVSRIFPTDDSPALPAGTVDQPLYDVMQEALKVHFQGLVFRERNAGRQIDEHMTDQGFNNQIGIHPETGFVFGGNSFNCGTWMDKMGSSDKAANRGKPATPRDGSAVELIGLSKSVVTWLDKLSQGGVYPYKGVERIHKNGTVTKWTFKEWADKIQKNFEKYFWVNTTPVPNEIRPDLINKRGIYKDCYGASQEWTDFQLRCNFPVAMVVAPELFDPKHAWVALQQAEKHLLGPLGMKTLDPEDWAYNGNYDNSNDSDNYNVAHGLNYHQGPEWVWPLGFYLRAKLRFAAANGELPKTLANTKVVLSKHFVELQTSPWRGLPELTNKDGAYCNDSSRTQAWSMSCILEVLHDLQKIEKDRPLIN